MEPGQRISITLPDGRTVVAEIREVLAKPTAPGPSTDPNRKTSSSGKQVYDARKKAGLTQKELAKQLKMSVRTINNIENDKSGPRGPNAGSILLVKQKLGIS